MYIELLYYNNNYNIIQNAIVMSFENLMHNYYIILLWFCY